MVQRSLRHYALPAVLAVDMRVRSPRGTQFRQWAIARLDEYLRVRDILALAAGYQSSAQETTRVFQFIQNKLHFAATGLTAPEIIARRAHA